MFSNYYLNLIEEINSGKTCNEICLSLGISRKQLSYYMLQLKNDGIEFNRKYYSDGVIKYEPIRKARDIKDDGIINIITPVNSTYLKMLAFSDPHFGNEKESPYMMERLYNYAIKDDIHIILCGGDLLDGTYTKGVKERSRQEVVDQIHHFIEDFPFDKNITVITVLGDHDYSLLTEYGINLKSVLDSKRHDIVTSGYNNTEINIKNDNIILFHRLNGGNITPKNSAILLKGHQHIYTALKREDGTLDVTLPPASEIMDYLPSVLKIELDFKDGLIHECYLRQILFLDNDHAISNSKYEFKTKNGDKPKVINNEEIFTKERSLEELEDFDKAVRGKTLVKKGD